MARGIVKAVQVARRNAAKSISDNAQNGGRFAGALSCEGYDGGYRDALDDVLLALNGVLPSRRGWWEKEKR